MSKKKSMLGVLIALSFLFLVFPVTVSSEEKSSVTVRAILPKNQTNKDVMHYDLKMKPKQEQIIELELTNSSKEDKEINLELTNAKTDNLGSIAYENSETKDKRNETLKLALTDIATVPDKVVVKGNSKEVVKIKLTTPDEGFDGVVAGAVRSTEVLGKANEKEEKDNSVVYTVALNVTESDKEEVGELELLEVFPSQVDGKNVLKANIQNKEAQFIEEISYDAKVTQKGNTETLYQTKVDNYRMAPNSSFELETNLKNQKFKEGEYTYKLLAESKRTGQKWELSKDFKIDKKEAKKFNMSAVGLEEEDKTYLYVIGLGGLLLLLALVASLVSHQKNKKKKSKRKKGKSHKKGKKTSSKKKQGKKKRTK